MAQPSQLHSPCDQMASRHSRRPSPNTPTNRNAKPIILPKATRSAVSRKRKPSAGLGQPSTRMMAVARRRAVQVGVSIPATRLLIREAKKVARLRRPDLLQIDRHRLRRRRLRASAMPNIIPAPNVLTMQTYEVETAAAIRLIGIWPTRTPAAARRPRRAVRNPRCRMRLPPLWQIL